MTEFLMFVIYGSAILLNCVTIYPAASTIKIRGWPALAWIAALVLIYAGAITFIPLGAVAFVDLAANADPQSDVYIYTRDVFFIANMALTFFAMVHAVMRAGKVSR